jgi:Cu+-exporting ATPase
VPDPTKGASIGLKIEGMACSGCAERVEEAIRATPGVVSASVNLETKSAEVTFSGSPDIKAVAEAVRQAGYEPVN